MHPILFKIGNILFYSHGIFIVLGIFLGSLVVYYLAQRNDLDTTYFIDGLIYSLILGIVGARLTYYFLYREQFFSLKEIFYLWDGGLVSYGGFVVGGLAFWLFLKIQNQFTLKWFDYLAIGASLGLFFGRIGDLLAGDYAGSENFSHLKDLQVFLPTPLLEGVLLLIIFLIMLNLYFILKGRNIISGVIFFLTILFYSAGRFIIDFQRNEKIIFLNISLGQLFSLILVIFSILGLSLLIQRGRKGD